MNKPNVEELETAVISAIINFKDAMDIAVEILKPEMFYSGVNQLIYSACYEMYRNNSPIDLLTISNQLNHNQTMASVGGIGTLLEISQKTSSPANIKYHSIVIKEKYLLRELIRISEDLSSKCYNPSSDVFDLIDEAESSIFDITKDNSLRQEVKIGDAYHQQIKYLENVQDGNVEGILTGLSAIDNVLNGIKKQNLVIIAARPAQGKTSLALTIAKNLCINQNIPCGFFSMEMSVQELTSKFTSLNSGIPLNYLVNSNVKGRMFELMMESAPSVYKAPLYINDAPALTIMQLRHNARKMVIKYGVKVIFVDYLGLMKAETSKGKTRENEVSEISSGLKAIAKELDIPVIALSQLNRATEGQEGKRPELRNLRDSGSIEQDADIVMFLFRPEYYGLDVQEKGYSEILIKKHRNGAVGDVALRFVPELTKFEDLNRPYAVYGEDINNKELGIELF